MYRVATPIGSQPELGSLSRLNSSSREGYTHGARITGNWINTKAAIYPEIPSFLRVRDSFSSSAILSLTTSLVPPPLFLEIKGAIGDYVPIDPDTILI